jgi:hypothetical protein
MGSAAAMTMKASNKVRIIRFRSGVQILTKALKAIDAIVFFKS